MSSWAEPLPRTTTRITDYLAWRPEWPAAVLVAGSWTWLALASVGVGPGEMSPSASGGEAHHSTMTTVGEPAWMMTPVTWAVMCVAMMLPLGLPAVRHVAFNSMRGQRYVAMALFTVGFLAPWLVFGALVLPVASDVVALDGTGLGLATVLLAGAAAWQVSPFKRWAVLSCSRAVPLPPYGPRAWASRLEFGIRQALRCAVACWPVMVLMVLLPHGLVGLAAMAVLTAMMLGEMQSRHRRRLLPWLGVPFGLAAVVIGMMAL